MPSVLFVCTANLYRSPLAAAFLREQLKDAPGGKKWVIGSAGIWTVPGLPPVPAAIDAAEAPGLDIKNNISTLVNKENLVKYDLVLVMEAGHQEAIVN
jgi:protein-tyrosine phosphatase